MHVFQKMMTWPLELFD